jgi:hypothetical protein
MVGSKQPLFRWRNVYSLTAFPGDGAAIRVTTLLQSGRGARIYGLPLLEYSVG